ncbi:MAG: hypothetical protein ACFB00_09705 [Parvularculaceae bacterium]
MPPKRPGDHDETDAAASREARLAEALRANLRRRKARPKAKPGAAPTEANPPEKSE